MSDEKARSSEMDVLRHALTEGLLYTHSRVNANTTKTLEASAFLYALIELLEEKGLLDVEELDERKRAVAKRLGQKFAQQGMGVILQDPAHDKYTFAQTAEIDCTGRINLCRAACCRLPFALSKQDIEEGVVHWKLGEPYMIDQGDDGYCNHLDRCTYGCTAYTHRPVPCRGFDCRNDKRIWLDFAKKVVNPLVEQNDWLQQVSEKSMTESLE
jgi:hypothetical protein